MICTELWNGQGMGNQLHSYLATRIRALDLNVDFGIAHPERFKGSSFLDLDFGKEVIGGETLQEGSIPTTLPIGIINYYREKEVRDDKGVDIRGLDPEYFFIEDGTWLEGLFQDERYFQHRLSEVDEWLKVEPIDIPDDTCVIGFRGGEFALYPDLFLTPGYWREAMAVMGVEHGIKRYEVHTDDAPLATEFFAKHGFHDTEYKVIHDIGINWRSIRYAKYAIIANSSFFIFPRLLKHNIGGIEGFESTFPKTIAPRYWGRRNTKVWSLPQNFYKDFLYI